MGRPWSKFVPQQDLEAYDAAGWGHTTGIGTRPALLVIDVQYRTTGTAPRPLLDAIKEFPTSCGEAAWDAIGHIAPLLALFREKGWPVLFPHVAPKTRRDAGRFAAKMPAVTSINAKGYDFVRELAPEPGDILLPKRHPSAFFGTALASYLIDLDVDTVVMTGCTTSGCIRASVVDAFSYNFRVQVPEDCVYDRGVATHAINLFDMAQKYADVGPSLGLIDELRSVPARSTIAASA